MQNITAIFNDESGATAIEYGLIAALISIAAILAMQTLGITLSNTFSTIATNLNSATSR